MKTKKILQSLLIGGMIIGLLACGDDNKVSETDKPAVLQTASYPIKVKGDLDLVDVGLGDNDALSWGVGVLTIEGTTHNISVSFSEQSFKDAGIDANNTDKIDGSVTLSLDTPQPTTYGDEYPVVGIEY